MILGTAQGAYIVYSLTRGSYSTKAQAIAAAENDSKGPAAGNAAGKRFEATVVAISG